MTITSKLVTLIMLAATVMPALGDEIHDATEKGDLKKANSFCSDANTVDVEKLTSQALEAMDKVTSYQSKMMMIDFTKESLKSKDFISIELRFTYEKPKKYEVDQISWEENVADHWISIGKQSYSEISGVWFKDDTGGRLQTNDGLSFEKFKPLLKRCKFTYSGTEPFGDNECFVIKAKLDGSLGGVWEIPKGQFENQVSFSILKATKQVAKVSIKFRGTDASGSKVDNEMQQWYRNYNKTFNITKPSEIAG